MADLIAAANAAPGSLRFGSTGVGTATHIGTEELNLAAGISAKHAPAGPDDAISDVVSSAIRGEIAYMMAPISIAAGPIEAGDLVALGITIAQPSPALRNVPTLADAGAPGYDFPIWYGAWAHTAAPPAIVKPRADDIAAAMSPPGVRDVLAGHGMLPMNLTSDEFVRFVFDETHRARRIIPAARPA